MIGDRLGNWIIDRELGRGGMGRVYLAREDPAVTTAPRQSAVKVLAPDLAQEAGFLERFQREIDVLRIMDHPNIVGFYDAGEHGGNFYYAMEYVDGESFGELLLKRGRLPWAEVLDMALQVCPALKHAHDRGIIHRDLKPPNILRSTAGQVKLTDFGVARLFASRQLTMTGAVVGTADFVSPEQAVGKPATKRSDLYSLGAVLYTLLTGRPPFKGNSVAELLHKHRYGQFDRPKALVPDLPYELDEVVCVLLEKEPEQRPADAFVLLRILEAVRHRLQRKVEPTLVGIPVEGTLIERKPGDKAPREPGPATLMSRWMREELEQQNRGGSLAQFLARPWVLVALLLVCVGLIAWKLWPLSAEQLYQRGAALMEQDDPAEWDHAWRDYFEPLNARFPDHPYAGQVAEFRRRLDEHAQSAQALRGARPARLASEAQWFYLQGLRWRQRGDEATARRVWENVVASFRGVPSEQAWVELSEQELKGPNRQTPTGERRWAAARKALERAAELKLDGKPEEAEAVWRSLEDLYRDDPSAQELLGEVRKARGG